MQINFDLKTIATVFGLLVAVTGGIGSYFVMKSEVSLLRMQVSSHATEIQELRMKSVSDGSTLEGVKEEVQEIKGDVKELLRK